MKIRVKYWLPIKFYPPDKRTSCHTGRIFIMFWGDSESKNSISPQKCLNMVSESSQLSTLTPAFSWVGIHCWFCLLYGRWTSWVTGIFDSMSALQPRQLPAYIPPVWRPAAQWQTGRQLWNPGVRSPILLLGSRSWIFLSLLQPMLFPCLPPHWPSCGRWNTAIPQSKVLGRERRAVWWKSQVAQVWPQRGLELHWDPVLQALVGGEEEEGVWAPWCEGEMVWATGAVFLWPATVVGGNREHTWASHLMGTPGWSWRLFHRLSHEFCLRRPPFCMNP